MLLLAIGPVIPILVAVGAAGVLGVTYLLTRKRGDALPPANDVPSLPPKPGEPDEPAPGDLPPTPAIVEGLVGNYEDSAFHEAKSGDSIARVVRKVLNGISSGKGNNVAMQAGLRRLMNRSTWNRTLYGEPMDDPYDYNGIATNRMFQAKHEDAVGVMRAGFMPARNISASGKREGPATRWGDPWIPALNRNAIQLGVSDPDLMLAQPWEDGTPATEPPPQLFEALQERPAA